MRKFNDGGADVEKETVVDRFRRIKNEEAQTAGGRDQNQLRNGPNIYQDTVGIDFFLPEGDECQY